MREAVRRVPAWHELGLVLGVTFGLQMSVALYSFAAHGFRTQVRFSDGRIVGLVAAEIALATLVGSFLWIRGLRPTDLGLGRSRHPILGGIALWLCAMVAYAATYQIATVAVPGLQDAIAKLAFSGAVSLPAVVLLCLVNPLFEEALTVGYLTRRLEANGAVFVVSLSALLRLAVHAYQGPFAVVSILPMAFMFAVVYWRTRDLWPLVVAHAIADYIGLTSLRR